MALGLRKNLPEIAACTSLVPLVMGIYGAIDPGSAMQSAFQWKVHNPEDKEVAYSLMKLYSYRSIGLGLGGIVLWYSGDRRAQGLVSLTGVVIALGDGLTAYQHSGGDFAEGMKHWFAIPISIGFGAGLLGWI